MKSSAAKRIPFYAEIGQYFSPDGSFDRKTFSDVFKQHVAELHQNYEEYDEFQKKASAWIESYMTSIFMYLKEKNMAEATYNLIKYTVDKCVSMGIHTVSLPSNILEDVFSFAPKTGGEEQQEKTKTTQDEKRQNIFKAALSVFADMGYHRATMDTIAAIAGIGKGSLYRLFASKEELLEQLLLEEYRKIINRIGEIFAANNDLLDEIQDMIEFWVTYISENPVVYRLIQNIELNNGASGQAHFYNYIAEHLPMLKERIVSLNKEGKFKYLNFYSVMYGIFGFIDGIVYKWIAYDMKYPLTSEIPIILECVFNGFLSEDLPRRHFCAPIIKEDVKSSSGDG